MVVVLLGPLNERKKGEKEKKEGKKLAKETGERRSTGKR